MPRVWKFICMLLVIVPVQLYAVTSSSTYHVKSAIQFRMLKDGGIKKPKPIRIKSFEKLTGKKLPLKQKILFVIFKKRILSVSPHNDKAYNGMATVSLVFGILGALFLIIGLLPFSSLIFLALVFGITAVILGTAARKKDPRNKRAKAGKLIGWITIGLFAASIIAIIAYWVLSGASFMFE